MDLPLFVYIKAGGDCSVFTSTVWNTSGWKLTTGTTVVQRLALSPDSEGLVWVLYRDAGG